MNLTTFDASVVYTQSGAALDAELTALWKRQQDAKRHALLEERRMAQREAEERRQPVYRALGDDLAAVETQAAWMLTFDRLTDAKEAGLLSPHQAEDLQARAVRIAVYKGWASKAEASLWLPPGERVW